MTKIDLEDVSSMILILTGGLDAASAGAGSVPSQTVRKSQRGAEGSAGLCEKHKLPKRPAGHAKETVR